MTTIEILGIKGKKHGVIKEELETQIIHYFKDPEYTVFVRGIDSNDIPNILTETPKFELRDEMFQTRLSRKCSNEEIRPLFVNKKHVIFYKKGEKYRKVIFSEDSEHEWHDAQEGGTLPDDIDEKMALAYI